MNEQNLFETLNERLSFYNLCIIVPFGFIGCVLSSLMFFTNKQMNKTTMGLLFGLFSASNALSLVCENIFIDHSTSIHFNLSGHFFCRINSFLAKIFPQFASWLQCYMALDRLVLIKYTNRFTLFKKGSSFVYLVLISLFAFVCLANVTNFFYFSTKTIAHSSNESSSSSSSSSIYNNASTIFIENQLFCTSSTIVAFISGIVDVLMRCWIPFAFLGIFILKSLRFISRSNKRELMLTVQAFALRSKRQIELTRTIRIQNFLFFFFHFPLSVSLFIFTFNKLFNNGEENGIVLSSKLKFYTKCSILMASIFQSATFLINLKFNKTFRREFSKKFRFQSKN